MMGRDVAKQTRRRINRCKVLPARGKGRFPNEGREENGGKRKELEECQLVISTMRDPPGLVGLMEEVSP